jgi:formate-nitrite transporter family protein
MKSRVKPGSGTTRKPSSPPEGAAKREAITVEQRTAISAQIVYRAILAEGEAELERPTSALAFSGFAAGLSMGFSFLTQGLIQSHLPQSNWAPLVARLGYPIGFLIVILGRQQLFTENTLTPILPLLQHKALKTLWNTLRLWAVVFLANWVGTMVFAWVIAQSTTIEAGVRPALLEIGREAMEYHFGTVIMKAIFAGWLIALLVWVLPFAETGRVGVIVLLTYVIALGSFNHVVAGSVETFYLVAAGEKCWADYLGGFMFPTLLGNVIGGVSLVAALNHAQVTAGQDAK